jgi:hypothetical protein
VGGNFHNALSNTTFLPEGSEKDDAEAAWSGEQSSNGKISAISPVTINLSNAETH